ncbi:response regulator [Aestuariispira insulae]|uniref:Histidine kinase-like protein n=1 Tax=Aestuariispira insulae TaxID=1461337 RepID=A0A3D9HMR5_9PROT|nr:response regulator [Aestuariispira insulae]RED50783.1 histidine kinase-like protein [Aestuariispira insulae]
MPRILVAEDEEILRDILAEELVDSGFEVIMAENGQQALELAKQNSPDLILSDFSMPVMDGAELVKALQQEGSGLSTVPVIMLTAMSDKRTELTLRSAGAINFLKKPCDFKILIAAINSQLGLHKNIQKHFRDRVNEFFVLQSENNADVDKDEFLTDLAGRHQRFLKLASLPRKLTPFLEEAHFRFQSPKEASSVAVFLSHGFEDPETAGIGLVELFYNAIEHGNLGIDFGLKTKLLADGIWHQEIERRLHSSPFNQRWVTVDYRKKDGQALVVISDEGEGFDWKPFLEGGIQQSEERHGRGIAIAVNMAFKELSYNEIGNSVTILG